MPGSLVEITAEPLTEQCAEPWVRGEHACLGISPFNSYFSLERITALVRWANKRFCGWHLFVPDQAAAYTLEAAGYAPERARRKAHRQARYLRNKIDAALAHAGIADGDALVLDGAALEHHSHYTALLAEAHEQFATDAVFRDACLGASRWVLQARTDEEPTSEQLHSAVRYFLAELPLFLDTPGLVGTDSSVFCYHQPPTFLHALYQRELPCRPHHGQGFATVTAEAESSHVH